jgi:hypothetical protein
VIAQVVTDVGDATARSSSELPAWAGATAFLAVVALVVLLIASIWTILKAGGQPGWHALVPVLNTYSLARAAQLGGCLIVVLTFVPCVNYVTYAYLWWSIGRRFGRSTGFCLGLVFLPPVFVPALAVSLQRQERRNRALPPVGAPGALASAMPPASDWATTGVPVLPAGPGPVPTAGPPPAPGTDVALPPPVALPPAPTAAPVPAPPPAPAAVPSSVLVRVDGLEVARLELPEPGHTVEDRRVVAVAAAAPVLEVELPDGSRTPYDLGGLAAPGATWTIETWIGPAGAAVEAVLTLPTARLVLQPVLLPDSGVTDSDLAGHGLASRGLALDDTQAGTFLVCRCASCGSSFVLETVPAAAALSCRTGQHTLAVDEPVARPVHPQVAAALPACGACGGDFAEQHPLRCPSCSMPFVELGRYPEDLPYETYAASHRGAPVQWFRPAGQAWRAADDGNWYPPSLFG